MLPRLFRSQNNRNLPSTSDFSLVSLKHIVGGLTPAHVGPLSFHEHRSNEIYIPSAGSYRGRFSKPTVTCSLWLVYLWVNSGRGEKTPPFSTGLKSFRGSPIVSGLYPMQALGMLPVKCGRQALSPGCIPTSHLRTRPPGPVGSFRSLVFPVLTAQILLLKLRKEGAVFITPALKQTSNLKKNCRSRQHCSLCFLALGNEAFHF